MSRSKVRITEVRECIESLGAMLAKADPRNLKGDANVQVSEVICEVRERKREYERTRSSQVK